MTTTNDPSVAKVMETYDVTIGIEVHCQLASHRKMFSSSKNAYGDKPNSNIDATCLGLPGALPTVNEECINLALRMGIALKSQLQNISIFARKNYFYPDLPKGYQITQYDRPVFLGGEVLLSSGKTIGIERIQLEEDAGKNIHVGSASLVDYNRAGVGLIEIVSEPHMASPEEASEYLKKIHNFAVHLDISDGDMERGNFRADANVSIKPKGSQTLGTRCEIKNVNSFKYIEKAIVYEILRQHTLLQSGGQVVQETRGYDSEKNLTYSQRSKESAHDYRYFPEPDLPPLIVTALRLEQARLAMPEMPESKALRFMEKYSLSEYDARVVSVSRLYSRYFEDLIVACQGFMTDAKTICNYFMTDVLRSVKIVAEKKGVSPEELDIIPVPLAFSSALLRLQQEGTISGRIAKDIFEEMLETGNSPEEIVKAKNLIQISDDTSIQKICCEVVDNNPEQLKEYLAGKEKLFGFFVGQAMKISGGKLNPSKVNEIFKSILKSKQG